MRAVLRSTRYELRWMHSKIDFGAGVDDGDAANPAGPITAVGAGSQAASESASESESASVPSQQPGAVLMTEAEVLDFVLDRSRPADDILPPDRFAERRHRSALLAMRGLVGGDDGGVLLHALQLRHCVDYGLDRRRVKQVAVPYRAADVPSERSEYSQPDTAIVLTCLSYYLDGLSRAQLRGAFEMLLKAVRCRRQCVGVVASVRVRGCLCKRERESVRD